MSASTHVPADDQVLIIGGGLTGLSAAVFLSHHGVRCLLLERHPGTSIHPRAVGFYPRTAELLAQVGIEASARQAAAGFEAHRTRAAVESLAGRVLFSREELAGNDSLGDVTPHRLLLLPQDRLEPLIRTRAEELGAELRFSTEVTSFTQDASGVSAFITGPDGRDETVRGSFLLACDGPRSMVREALGIGRSGAGVLSRHVSIAFAADLRSVLGERRYSVVHVENPEVTGILVHDDTLTQGTLVVQYRPEEGQRLDDFSAERCAALVRAAIGVSDCEVTVRSCFPWDMAELVAERYAEGRVILAGDAAHVVPPTGGYGANTGIADAHNLAWKVALAVKGMAGQELIDSYAAERQPIGEYVAHQGLLQLAVRSKTATPQQESEVADELTVTMGQPYRSAAVVPPRGAAPLAARHPRELRGELGTRAPHAMVEHAGKYVSTLDFFGSEFVLLAGADAGAWARAAVAAAAPCGALVRLLLVAGSGDGPDLLADPQGHLARGYALEPDDVVLVRPDGIVGWRTRAPGGKDQSRDDELAAVLRTILDRQ